MSARLFIYSGLGLLVAGLAGCPPQTDLNQPCTLVKSSADGGAVPLLNNEIPNTHTDFISFGSTDCDNLVCVRDADLPRDGGPNDIAYGYCSQPCNPNGSSPCPSYDPNLDLNASTKLNCRPLLLDEQTLAAICNTDAGACQEFFANTNSPYFCARGQTPDGG